jgi:hypothetical protein
MTRTSLCSDHQCSPYVAFTVARDRDLVRHDCADAGSDGTPKSGEREHREAGRELEREASMRGSPVPSASLLPLVWASAS